jgi:hypothetical protein
MLRFYQADCPGGKWIEDKRWIVMADSIENAVRQLRKKLDDEFYQIHIPSATRVLRNTRMHEIEFDDFGVSKTIGQSKFYEV